MAGLPKAMPMATLLLAAAALVSGCTSTGTKGVACATPSSFQHALELRGSDCRTSFATMLTQLDDGSEETRLHLARKLEGVNEYELAVHWYEQEFQDSGSREALSRLLALHRPQGELADDAAYLRYEIKRAQQQQSFAEEVSWPRVNQAQPLYVQSSRSVILAEPDLDAAVLEGLSEDERVYLVDVVMLQDSGEYWVEAYFPPTLQIGWIPAQDLAQQTAFVRQQMAALDQYEGRYYAQQLVFAAVIASMDMTKLTALSEGDYFAGASRQQTNTQALLQGLGAAADNCLAEIDTLEVELERYLMEEGPAPQWHRAPVTEQMNEGLRALTSRGDDSLRAELVEDAYQHFRIRVQGQVEQRLCTSLPNVAGNSELSEPACEATRRVQQCINRANAIFDYLEQH
ncbi:hypothetical protein [Aliidiomarina soli]|uniref:SH3b domain-containing protein n=1 Tax=Aliidiomarina soli TaxID=1928574 RepID=A0A432WGQ8_9GAMM|nr:hypothetical protein [Aliidiomarina soli]RUO32990.1 hypothetical protein CWE14_07025 [Aliidiomarina soli]